MSYRKESITHEMDLAARRIVLGPVDMLADGAGTEAFTPLLQLVHESNQQQHGQKKPVFELHRGRYIK